MSISSSLIRSVLIEELIEDFRKLYEDRFGKCFRTEIRDTGTFICGIHQSSVWGDPESECPELEAILELIEDSFESSVDRSAVPPNPRLNSGQSQPKSIRETAEEFDLWEPTRDSYNVPIRSERLG